MLTVPGICFAFFGVLRFEALGLSLGLFGVGQDAGLELGAL